MSPITGAKIIFSGLKLTPLSLVLNLVFSSAQTFFRRPPPSRNRTFAHVLRAETRYEIGRGSKGGQNTYTNDRFWGPGGLLGKIRALKYAPQKSGSGEPHESIKRRHGGRTRQKQAFRRSKNPPFLAQNGQKPKNSKFVNYFSVQKIIARTSKAAHFMRKRNRSAASSTTLLRNSMATEPDRNKLFDTLKTWAANAVLHLGQN